MNMTEVYKVLGDMTSAQYATIHKYYRAMPESVSKDKLFRSIAKVGVENWCKEHAEFAPPVGGNDEKLSDILA